jgi:pimeloyl-ACP methyl ester carboxylesterase
MTFRRWLAAIGLGVLLVALAAVHKQLPAVGAAALLHPVRRHVGETAPDGCQTVGLPGDGVDLTGWTCRAAGIRRGTLVYLHGVADNRGSSRRVIERFVARGFDVLAYDSRAHGDSGGDVCTYGFHEKQDLRRVLDTIDPGPVVLIGGSLGAAVALQAAAVDTRIRAVVAAETFSDLRTVARERAPFFFTRSTVTRAFQIAEHQARFEVDAVSPVAAAARITVPVLLIHGAADTDTPPDHSRRVFAALAGPKHLLLVPGARHNESLRSETWAEIEQWVIGVLDRASN